MSAKFASTTALFFIASVVFSCVALSDAHVVKDSKATLKNAERIPAHCTLPINVATGLCVCYLNYSNSPQFSFYTAAELAAGRQTCLASFQSESFILGSSSSCNRFRQNLPSQDVNLYWLIGEANALISVCAPGVPLLRFP